MHTLAEVTITGPVVAGSDRILTTEAVAFVAQLHRQFNPVREKLLRERAERQAFLDAGERPHFLAQTREIREAEWQVAPVPGDLQNRQVEITGPADRKMMINALNSGAQVFMADLEDSLSPTWANLIRGQENLIDAVRGSIEHTGPDGRVYRLNEKPATLMVRPRGWHLAERHLLIDGQPVSASIFDFGLYLFHNAQALLAKGTGAYFYLPKLESHREARLWNELFCCAQERLGLPVGSIRATVLIETILAAFEMDEILYELREHVVGLNAGRWDYIFSLVKKFRNHPEFLLPDRRFVTMAVPSMRAYAQLLVKSCHRRGAHAIGGMAAFIPSRRDEAVNERAFAQVKADKLREAEDGFDGSWVAHPDLVPVAQAVFASVLADRPNQTERLREEVQVSPDQLLDVRAGGGELTELGLRTNISVALQYIESWLQGVGAAAIENLMEDAATAEISRCQIWQWIRHGAHLPDGQAVTPTLVRSLALEELRAIQAAVGGDGSARHRLTEAMELLERVALRTDLPDFLTTEAYYTID